MVTDALSLPMTMSGNACGFIKSAGATFPSGPSPRLQRGRQQRQSGQPQGCGQRHGGGALAKFAAIDRQLKLLALRPWNRRFPSWIAQLWQCRAGLASYDGVRFLAHFRLTAAPNRASAALRAASSIFRQAGGNARLLGGSGGTGGCGGTGLRSGAWRSAMRPMACQPKKRLTPPGSPREVLDFDGRRPSTRSISVAGSG